MPLKQKMFLDWLYKGVVNKVISEGKAKALYEERYAKVSKLKFSELLFDVYEDEDD